MAALAGANTTTLTETIPTESINGLVLPPANLIRVYQAFTWQCPATGAKHVFPQIVASAVTGTQTESDEFTATDLETVKEEVSPAMIGKRSFHSDQVDLEGSILTPQARVNAMASRSTRATSPRPTRATTRAASSRARRWASPTRRSASCRAPERAWRSGAA